jgi:hypothetical protein
MMTFRSRRRLTALALACALASFPVFCGRAEAGEDPQDSAALATAAELYGLPLEALTIDNKALAEYPLQGVTADDYKIQDTRDGSLYRVTLLAGGKPVDPDQLDQQELDTYARLYGKLDVRLADRLASLPPGDAVPVVIWLQASSPSLSRPDLIDDPTAPKPTEEEIDQIYQKVDSAWSAVVAGVVKPAAEKLKALGIEAESDSYSPALFASLTAGDIAKVNTWPEVERLYLDEINKPDLSVAIPTVLGNVVHGRGITGAGVRIGEVEVGGRAAVANPWLPGLIQIPTSACAAPTAHSTAVAGILRSTHGVQRGTAPGVTLLVGGSCGGVSAQLTNVTNIITVMGFARAVNLSWGANIGLVPGANDRFYDNLVLNGWRTVVKSAGNEAGPCNSGTGNISSPGLGYNVITVGNFDAMGNSTWPGDTMNNCSSWRNPTSGHNDREKPEVAAPGSNFTSTTTAFPWIGPVGSGTSYAAPIVTGATALLIQRNGFFSVWPETVKALLMATAVHNIEGATRLSQFDGAGGVVLDRADDVAGGVTGGYGGRSYTCALPLNLDIATIWLASGIRTRVAIAWDNDPNYASYNTQPGADLDLSVINPGGGTVASSLSWDNTYEIVDFTAQQTGFHRIRVNKFRCSFNPQWLGWSWRQGN